MSDEKQPAGAAERKRSPAGWKLPLTLAGMLGLLIWGMVDSVKISRVVMLQLNRCFVCAAHCNGGFSFGYSILDPTVVRQIAEEPIPYWSSTVLRQNRPRVALHLQSIPYSKRNPRPRGLGGIPYLLPILIVFGTLVAGVVRRVVRSRPSDVGAGP